MASGADPSRLLFEVPETTLNENPDAAVSILQRMVDCNVRIAVDDFGSSLAPLNHLVRLPIDMVKLDPKLTAAATSTGRHQAVLESLIRLGRTLGVQVVAQGIETPEQLRRAGAHGLRIGPGSAVVACAGSRASGQACGTGLHDHRAGSLRRRSSVNQPYSKKPPPGIMQPEVRSSV